MATIEKRERKKGVVYQVDVRVAGYPRQKKTFKRLTDAKAWAAKTESDIKSGQFQPINTQSKRKTCQRRSKTRPKGGAKVGHFGVGREGRIERWRPVDRAPQIAGG